MTIKDIARRCRVSVATVSRVLNGFPHINPALRDRVEREIRRVGFRPNGVARSLVLKKTRTIGVVLSDITNPFYSELARGIEDQVRVHGYTSVLCSTDNLPRRQLEYLQTLLEKRVDGLILGSVRRREPEVAALAHNGFPVVLVNRYFRSPHVDSVVVDNYAGSRRLMEYVFGLGHRRIAHIRGPLQFSTGYDRYRGYRDGLRAHGLTPNPRYVVPGAFRREDGVEATRRLLDLQPRPTAIFAGNDLMALGALEALAEAGLRVPADMAVVGFDDVELASYWGIRLTTMSQRIYEMGRLALDLLMERIEKRRRESRAIILQPQLVIRGSCGGQPIPVGLGQGSLSEPVRVALNYVGRRANRGRQRSLPYRPDLLGLGLVVCEGAQGVVDELSEKSP